MEVVEFVEYIGCFMITLVQYKIHYNQFQPKGVGQFPTRYKGSGTIPNSVLNALSMKQEITSKEFSSLRTVKGTAEVFTKSISAGVCYVVIFCIVRPNSEGYSRTIHQVYFAGVCYVVIFCIVRPNTNSVEKLFSSEEYRSGARTINPQICVLLG